MNYSVKKGDAVKIIAGNDKGKTGTILSVDASKGRVIVKGDGLTTQKHFVKPRSAQERGGIVEKERAIDISNVMIICPSCGKATKVAHKVEVVDGKTVKTRICKECQASLDEVKASKAKTAAKKAAPKKTTAKKAPAKKAAAADKE